MKKFPIKKPPRFVEFHILDGLYFYLSKSLSSTKTTIRSNAVSGRDYAADTFLAQGPFWPSPISKVTA